MAFSALRRISRKAGAWSTASPNSLNRCSYGGAHRRRIGTSTVCDEASVLPSTLLSRTSPWLMLPPAFEGEESVYKFYSLAENRVLSVPKRAAGGEGVPDDDAVPVGSSYGWLVSMNRPNNDLFLSNPLSRRHLKLPSIHTVLSYSLESFADGCAVTKLIISSPSPDEDEDCRAMVIFDCENRLAFCCPGRRATEATAAWSIIGDRYTSDGYGKCYVDFVYSSSQQLFYCIDKSQQLEAWDLRNPSSPRKIPMDDISYEHNFRFCAFRSDEEFRHKVVGCDKKCYLVEHGGDIYLMRRFFYYHMAPDGSSFDVFNDDVDDAEGGIIKDCTFPHKTVDFEVFRYDPEARMWRYLDRSLDGLVLFIGSGHSFALRAADFPELKPNSIYFTDGIPILPEVPYGGHDLGIFNYEDRTFSPCYFPCDYPSLRKIDPSPLWFTPNPR